MKNETTKEQIKIILEESGLQWKFDFRSSAVAALAEFVGEQVAHSRRELREEIKNKINKEIQEGNPLIGGSGICRCVYDGDGKRYGMCMRCANDSFYAHRKGELHFARTLLKKLEGKI